MMTELNHLYSNRGPTIPGWMNAANQKHDSRFQRRAHNRHFRSVARCSEGGRFVSREFRAVRNVVDGWRIAAALYQRFNLGGKIAALTKKNAYNNGVARCRVDWWWIDRERESTIAIDGDDAASATYGERMQEGRRQRRNERTNESLIFRGTEQFTSYVVVGQYRNKIH